MSEGSLIVLKKNGSEGFKYPMHKKNVYKIGPGPECNLRFNIDNYIENVCAISTNKKGPATLSKLSSCPILLNNVEIKTSKSLKYGDVLKIGTKIFKWGPLIQRESFTRNVFKTPSVTTNKNSLNLKLRSSPGDFRSSGGKNTDRLSTWRETEENVQTNSNNKGNTDNIAISNSPMKLTSSETEQTFSSGKSKTLPKNHGSQNKTPSVSAVKCLKFPSRSVDKNSTSLTKKKYFDPNLIGISSKIPKKYFTDKPTTSKIPKVTKPLIKTFEHNPETSVNILKEFKENMKTPTQKTGKRISTRSENKKNMKLEKTPVALTEVNVKTPDSVGFKLGTPNIKLVKSVNKKNASLKKSLDNKILAKKRKISNIADDEFFTSKRFKFADNSEAKSISLLEDESMGNLFDDSLSLLEETNSTNSPHRSVRKQNNSLALITYPISPNYCNVSGIKSLERRSAGKSSLKTSTINRRSLQLQTSENKLYVKTRFTESNLISFETPEREVGITKTTCLTPKAQSSPLINVCRSAGRPPATPKHNLTEKDELKRKPSRSKTPTNNLTNVSRNTKIRIPGRPPKSPKNDLTDIRGVKTLLRTPGRAPKSPKNDLTNIVGVKKLLKTPSRPPKSPKNDLTDIRGVKTLLRTPGRAPKSPKNDLTNIVGVKKLLKTPSRPPKSPKNDLTDIRGVKTLLRTPGRAPKSPKNDLTNVAGVKILLRSPRRPQKSPKNDLTNVAGVKNLLRTPGRSQKSPKNDLTNVAGVKILLRSPRRPQKSPKNDLTNVAGVKTLLKTPGRSQKSPKNDLTNVAGVKILLRSPRRPQKSPKNDLTDITSIKVLFRSRGRPPKSPKNELMNVSGVENLLRNPGSSQKSPKNDLNNIKNAKTPSRSPKSLKNDSINISVDKNILRSPGLPQKSPKDYPTNVRTPKSPIQVFGVKNLLMSPSRLTRSKIDRTSISGIEKLHTSSSRSPKAAKKDKALLSPSKRSSKNADITAVQIVETQNSPNIFEIPKNDLCNISGIKTIFSTPQNPNSKNDESNIESFKQLLNISGNSKAAKYEFRDVKTVQKNLTSPGKKQNEVKNDLSDVEGVDSLFNISKLNSSSTDIDAAFDQLKDGNNESFNLTFAINSKLPLRTYERRGHSLSPPKSQKLSENRTSLRLFSNSTKKEVVQKWLNEHVLNKKKSLEKAQILTVKNNLQEVGEMLISKNKHLNLETENLPPSSPTTRSRKTKKSAENTVTPPKTRRTRKQVEEPEVIAPRTRRNKKITEEIVEQTEPKIRAMRKRTKEDEVIIEEVAAKRPRKQASKVKQVQFEVPEEEEIEEKIPATRNKRGKKVTEINESTEKKTTRSRQANNTEKMPAEDEAVEKNGTTKGRRGKKIDEPADNQKEPAKKKLTRSKKNEEIVEPVKEQNEKIVTRKTRAKKTELASDQEMKKPVRRVGRPKKTEETVEAEINRPTSSKKQKTDENYPELKSRTTRGKKKVDEKLDEPVLRNTRSRRNK